MKRRSILLIGICVILASLALWSVWAKFDPDDYQVSLPFIAGAERYSFFVAGHTYGVPEVDNPGVHPPFKALLPQLNSSRLDFGVFTGDIVIRSTPANWDEIDADLAELTPPVHFVVGNHEMTGKDVFVSRYGPTYYGFEHRGDLFIVLDGELNQDGIVGEQMTFLQDTLDGNDWQNVFVFVHKLIWIIEDTPYYILQSRINGTVGYNFQSNFWSEVEPLFRNLDAQVYVIAGDVGVTWAMPLFYERDGNIHLIASGMGGSKEENFVIFDVGPTPDDVQIRVQRLDGKPPSQGTIQAYNLEYYNNLP